MGDRPGTRLGPSRLIKGCSGLSSGSAFRLDWRGHCARFELDHHRDEPAYSVFVEINNRVVFVALDYRPRAVLTLRDAGTGRVSGHSLGSSFLRETQLDGSSGARIGRFRGSPAGSN